MKITIIGASSGIGLQAVKQALARGHHVTTLSRNIDTLPAHAALVKVQGTATSVHDMKKSIDGTDAILITIGKRKGTAPTLFIDTAHALMQAVNELQLHVPVIAVTGFGAGDSLNYSKSWFIKLITGVVLKKEYAYKTQMEKLFAQSNMRWEIVRPAMLSNGPLTQQYQTLAELHAGIKVTKIARADVAHFLINQAEHPSLLYHYVTLTY